MLETKMARPNERLRPYVWAYGMTTGRVDSAPLVIPLPARPKQLLTFSFADRYCTSRGSAPTVATPRVAVVGPQSCAHPGLVISGCIDHFTVHFQPSGFNRLFRVPMTHLTDSVHEAHGVTGSMILALEQRLGEIADFAARIQLVEAWFSRLLGNFAHRDPVAMAANRLFATHGTQRVSAMAQASGLSTRQFERRFLIQVGLPPKFYSRIIRFNAVLNDKLRDPNRTWSHISHEYAYYDQMHFVRDCRDFTGQAPTGFLARLDAAPEFHTFYASGDSPSCD